VPTQLLSITASDGRQLTFTYVAGSDRIQSVSDGSRTWTYLYATGPQSWDTGTARTTYLLSGVTQPDGSSWQFSPYDVWIGSCEARDATALDRQRDRRDRAIEAHSRQAGRILCDPPVRASSDGSVR